MVFSNIREQLQFNAITQNFSKIFADSELADKEACLALLSLQEKALISDPSGA